MSKQRTYITVTDQFCGAGGSSIGATASGAELRLALNHWSLAIETHNTNFPDAAHDCTDISACDPRRYPSTDILITSPECTNHTLAKGQRRKGQNQPNLFGVVPTAEEERSRATMWDVCRFSEYHRYSIIIVENVIEARMWVMWDAWLQAMNLLGYEHQCVYMNSMHTHPTPQSRDRMYVVFWRKGNKRPNLAVTPTAFCQQCGHDVSSVQAWKQGRASGRYRKQYVFACPTCHAVVEPYYYAAYNAIDWSLPTQRIGDRQKPLKETTLRRVRIGLEKFGAQAQVVANYTPGFTKPVTEPLGTVTTQDHHALMTPPPFLIDTQFTHARNDRSSGISQAMPTQTGQQSRALVVPPFLTSYYGTNQGSQITEAMPTMTTRDRHSLVVPPFVLGYYTRTSGIQAALSGVNDPLPTQTTRPLHYVVQPPYIINLQGSNQPTQLHEALQTQLGTNHKWLVQPGQKIKAEDCGLRMLEPHECGKAMAFPETYQVKGNKRERVKQYGNAVTPPVMAFLVQRCMETFK